jgi:Icc-related predicted phosphoesterase
MRVCYTNDFHGREPLYERLDELLRLEAPELLILGGDMFPDGQLDDPAGTQGAYVERDFIPRVRRWRAARPALHVACILGNHDWLCTEEVLRAHHEAGDVALLDPRREWSLNGTVFLGYSPTPPTPYWVKDFERLDLRGDVPPEMGGAVWDPHSRSVRAIDPAEHFTATSSIESELSRVIAPQGRWIFVCHSPPYGTHLDRLPRLRSPVGSRAVRRFIEASQPAVTLHGHIHESPLVTGRYFDRLGRTLCINPGQDREMFAVLFDSDDPAGTLRHTVLT